MQRLPYRDRARLEIRFLTMLAEIEDLCAIFQYIYFVTFLKSYDLLLAAEICRGTSK